jgi:hypothetical protein
MSPTQKATLDRFTNGRFEVINDEGIYRWLSSKKALKVLKHNPGILFVKSTGEVKE